MNSREPQVRIEEAMQRDQFRLHRKFRHLAKPTTRQSVADATRLEEELQASIDLRNSRRLSLPTIELDPELPIFKRADEIRQAIQHHQVTVVSGETGSGKSTQLPLIGLQAGFGVGGFIGHTQPRRIAARGVAARVASQLKCSLGDQVGCKIRFSDQSTDRTLVKLMTDGILLAETQTDRFLDAYDLLIIDEAHERSLNIDFLLGYVKRLLPKRRSLRLVITSATIDTQRFAEHFSVAGAREVPVIHTTGRTYPVEIRYRDPTTDDALRDLPDEDKVVEAIRELADEGPGDMLVFLPTEHDIRTVAKKLRSDHVPGGAAARTEILPLYARLPTEQQNQIFQPGNQRRIVLATNVAESSITVPRIHYVIDSGTARISRYSPRRKVQRLPIEAISQASADQRAGRCGRIGPGICVRLYSQTDFESRAKFTTPEIRRTNLASVILQTQALKLGAVGDFPFIDPPRPESIRDGYKTLLEINAVDESRHVTPLGRKLSRLPVDPRIGRMLFAASENHCLAEVLIIAAALEIQDPRMRPEERKGTADELHSRFRHPRSDFLSWLKLWQFFHRLKATLSRHKFRRACQENFLSYVQIQQWSDVHRQLRDVVRQAGLSYHSVGDDENEQTYRDIHLSLATGLLSGVAQASDKFQYTGAGGIKFHIWPGSGLFETRPRWILAAEIVETTKCYGRTVAAIEPEWLEPLAAHLLKQRFVDPHWSRRSETAMAYENLSLFGLPIVQRRRVQFAPIDPELARKLFIEQGLTLGELRHQPPFLKRNQQVIEQARAEVARSRRRDLIIDEATIEQFYEERLPAAAVDRRALQQLIKRQPELEQQLTMQLSDLIPETHDHDAQYPAEVQVGQLTLPVHYRFAPGEPDDGATLELPPEAAAQLDPHQLGWLIPGLIRDRVEAMIRSLPKPVRRNLIPAPDTAAEVAARLEPGTESFEQAVARELSRIGGQPVGPGMFQLDKVDENLLVNLRLVDENGEPITQSRQLNEVIRHLPENQKTEPVFDSTLPEWHRDQLRTWDWGELPKSITAQRGVTTVPLYPAIVDQQDAVGLRLFDQQARAIRETRQGLVRLLQLNHRKYVRDQINWLPDLDKLALLASPLFNQQEQFHKALADLLVRIAFVEFEKIPRDPDAFENLQRNAPQRIGGATQDLANWLPKMLNAYHQLRLILDQQPKRNAHVVADVRQQLNQLTEEGFLKLTPWFRLKQYPRYLQAIEVRFERLSGGHAERDRELAAEFQQLWARYEQLANEQRDLGRLSPELEQLRWMLEEFRVSLFAQQLGTSEKVSVPRLEKQFAKLQ